MEGITVKKLKIYKHNGEYVIERVNQFNHSTKRFFITEVGLIEGIEAYMPVIGEYEIELSEDLLEVVKGQLAREGF
jgi:hypothetical protein